METEITAIFWLAFAVILALLEIEIEGPDGWAYKLPTWYRTTGIGKIYGRFMNKKPMTGYHTFLFILLNLIFHASYFNGAPWTWEKELYTISLIMTISVVWDYLWFVLNPHFGWRGFKKNRIWWHAKSVWVLGFPMDFYSGIAIALILNLIIGNCLNYLIQLAIFIGGTIIIVIVSPLYHKWYMKMRWRDDRPK
jgi:hypothetical protein